MTDRAVKMEGKHKKSQVQRTNILESNLDSKQNTNTQAHSLFQVTLS